LDYSGKKVVNRGHFFRYALGSFLNWILQEIYKKTIGNIRKRGIPTDTITMNPIG